jgi:hypothetical protein
MVKYIKRNMKRGPLEQRDSQNGRKNAVMITL